MDTKNVIWLAGILEGEGSFCYQSTNKKSRPLPWISIAMSDEDVIAKVSKIWNKKYSGYQPKNMKQKMMYQTAVRGNLAASWMMILYQFMGNRRSQKIKYILEEWRKTPNTFQCRSIAATKSWITRRSTGVN